MTWYDESHNNTLSNHTVLHCLLIHKTMKQMSASNKPQREEGTQTFPGVGGRNILCHIAERRLLRVPKSHWTLGGGRSQQKFDYM